MLVEGRTWLQVTPVVSTVTPEGGGCVAVPAKFGAPAFAWLPLTATGMGAGVTVVAPGSYTMV